MGRGKKNNIQLQEKANCSAPARNLRSSDLGAVIFGCKNHTIRECLSTELFGLPYAHYAYVKNINPGLILFLFNYSDRKLHGIFEATSYGQLAINPSGWTEDGREYTPYPAQVKVRLQRCCYPLTEDQFKPIIANNYYEQSLFWFELDQTQTSKLVSLFTSLPYDEGASFSKNTTQQNALFHPLPTTDTRQEGESSILSRKETVGDASNSIPQKSSSGTDGQKTWSSLFKNSTDPDVARKDEHFWTEALNSCHPLDQSNASHDLPCSDREISETNGTSQCSEEVDDWETNWENPPPLRLSDSGRRGVKLDANQCHDESFTGESKWKNSLALMEISAINLADDSCSGEVKHEDRCTKVKAISSDSKTPLGVSNMEVGLRHHDLEEEETQASEFSTDYSVGTSEKILEENHGKDVSHTSFSAVVHPEMRFPTVDEITATSSSVIQSVVVKLMQENEGLKGSLLKQIMKVNYLEKELADSRAELEQLKIRNSMVGPGEFSSVMQRLGISTDMEETILIVGGFDGSTWLADLNTYLPSRDTMTLLCPMTFQRSYASAAKLGGELFIFGGIDGDVWYDTVESYNLRSNQWVSRASLNRKKGSLAGVCLNDKIFAIGGGNGVDCFDEVEMYDPNIERWIYTRSMKHKRFAPAAAEMNNAIYVTGGYDGSSYTSSVEKFDPREHSWARVGDMSTKRGCHSVAVLNEKLYAMGGCDGNKIHSTVEIFDPRMNIWMIGESMNNGRGYSSAVVVGGKIYIIGGLKEMDEILDTVECYKEGYGWEVTNLKALGKRCFFSALVL